MVHKILILKVIHDETPKNACRRNFVKSFDTLGKLLEFITADRGVSMMWDEKIDRQKRFDQELVWQDMDGEPITFGLLKRTILMNGKWVGRGDGYAYIVEEV